MTKKEFKDVHRCLIHLYFKDEITEKITKNNKSLSKFSKRFTFCRRNLLIHYYQVHMYFKCESNRKNSKKYQKNNKTLSHEINFQSQF